MGDMIEYGRVNLMLGKEVALTRVATQEISLLRIPESKRSVGALGAKDNHVDKVGVLGFHEVLASRGMLAEDAASWEGSQDRPDDEACWVEVEVAGVVLHNVSPDLADNDK